MHVRLAFVALALWSTSAQADVAWRGDFETGDKSQWSKAQEVSPDRLQVVSSPVRQDAWALRVEVRQGDDPIHASGNRADPPPRPPGADADADAGADGARADAAPAAGATPSVTLGGCRTARGRAGHGARGLALAAIAALARKRSHRSGLN